MTDVTLSVCEFVALLNQTLEYAYPNVTIIGELANFRISKNKWVYFDLKDDEACVKFFGTIYQLPGPLEDGMVVAVTGVPRLHPQYGFSVTVQQIRPVGEGSIKKAAQLLQAKLAAEGLFDPERKRFLPYPPKRIGLIASAESAAYKDFMKILNARWGGVEITLVDVQVQGDPATPQICAAIEQLNQLATPPEVLVITRGGGSAEDLAAFSTEQVTRAVAASRIPTLVAIGHEVDTCLAELAADQRASTPSNAAELLTPDKKAVAAYLAQIQHRIFDLAQAGLASKKTEIAQAKVTLGAEVSYVLRRLSERIKLQQQTLAAYNPQEVLKRGYTLVRQAGRPATSGERLKPNDILDIEFADAKVIATINEVTKK
jgi:exodeoxyribonuclease VII large subunit